MAFVLNIIQNYRISAGVVGNFHLIQSLEIYIYINPPELELLVPMHLWVNPTLCVL